MQAFYMNSRRELFKDRRVRRALAFAFDFQWTNKTVYYGQYAQPESFFAPPALASSGPPPREEPESLDRHRGRVPDEVFPPPHSPPNTHRPARPRQNRATPATILQRAGGVG